VRFSNIMKVRWTTGSVRFRITPTELAKLVMGGPIVSTLPMPGGRWRVSIAPGDVTSLAMVDGVLTVTIAGVDLDELADQEKEGVYFATPDDLSIRYYIEKDFPCAHPRPPAANDPVTETFTAPADFKLRHKTDCE
jgi:hypothetical protein